MSDNICMEMATAKVNEELAYAVSYISPGNINWAIDNFAKMCASINEQKKIAAEKEQQVIYDGGMVLYHEAHHSHDQIIVDGKFKSQYAISGSSNIVVNSKGGITVNLQIPFCGDVIISYNVNSCTIEIKLCNGFLILVQITKLFDFIEKYKGQASVDKQLFGNLCITKCTNPDGPDDEIYCYFINEDGTKLYEFEQVYPDGSEETSHMDCDIEISNPHKTKFNYCTDVCDTEMTDMYKHYLGYDNCTIPIFITSEMLQSSYSI